MPWSSALSPRRSGCRARRCSPSRSGPCIPSGASAATSSRAARRVLRGARGRVLRHRRSQRLGQEHAAEVPGRDLPDRRGRHLRARPHVDVHRARRRLQPRPRRARQRHHQRDHARPLAGARRASASTPVIDFAELRGVRRPQAEELLVGHARAPGVLGDDPGRRRHPADRRGARGRRRRVPAEVLRRVHAHARRGPDDPVRHPRHGRGRALLRSRDAARDGRTS